ncbi:hypothetical protein [Paenibacillus pseudetheri]|nr:hypothetical protein [Paenibacillus pseudetheri]
MYLPEFRNESVVRLSVSQVGDDRIEDGVQRISEGIQKLLKYKKEIHFI